MLFSRKILLGLVRQLHNPTIILSRSQRFAAIIMCTVSCQNAVYLCSIYCNWQNAIKKHIKKILAYYNRDKNYT